MAKGNDQVAQVMAVLGLILLIIAIIYAFFVGSKNPEEDAWGYRVGSKRVLYLFLAAISFLLGALVWSSLDAKHGGSGNSGQGGHHGKPSYKAQQKNQQSQQAFDFPRNERAFESNSDA